MENSKFKGELHVQKSRPRISEIVLTLCGNFPKGKIRRSKVYRENEKLLMSCNAPRFRFQSSMFNVKALILNIHWEITRK